MTQAFTLTTITKLTLPTIPDTTELGFVPLKVSLKSNTLPKHTIKKDCNVKYFYVDITPSAWIFLPWNSPLGTQSNGLC